MTSPPYWGLRKYDIPDIVIGGEPECEHKWVIKENVDKRGVEGSTLKGSSPITTNRINYTIGTCKKCGAWKGQYGLELSFHLFIEHTLLWAEEAWRVLKDDGVFFLNMGDTYASGSGGCVNPGGGEKSLGKHLKVEGVHNLKRQNVSDLKRDRVKPKTKLMIPHRVAIGIVEAGWILRNDIVWYKPNSMPESCQDRFSKKWEAVFMFTKSKRYFFDLDAVREPHAGSTLIRAQRGRNGIGVPESALPGNSDNTPDPGAISEKGKNPGDVWPISPTPSPFDHYAMWPEELVERMVRCSSRPGDTVVDPFCGSGTTLRVVEALNRVGVGIDLGYKDIQEKRLADIQKELPGL